MNGKKKVLSFIGSNFSDCIFSILVVGTQQFGDNLKVALSQCRIPDSDLRLVVHSCRSVQCLLNVNCKINFDFIAFAIDSRMSNALQLLRKDLSQLDQHFVTMSRVCLVASNEIAYQNMSILSDRLFAAATKLHCPLLLGPILDEAECPRLAQRVLNLAASVVGAKSGVPLLLVRSDTDSHRLGADCSAKDIFQMPEVLRRDNTRT